MTITEWELERMRAWTAFMAAELPNDHTFKSNADAADCALAEWEKRFPKPEAKPIERGEPLPFKLDDEQ